MGRNDFIPWIEHFNEAINGCQTRSETSPKLSIFYGRKVFFQGMTRWVQGTRVFISLVVSDPILHIG